MQRSRTTGRRLHTPRPRPAPIRIRSVAGGLLLLVLLVTASGCVSTRVETWRRPDTDPSRSTTVAVLPIASSTVVDKSADGEHGREMERALRRELAARGYRLEPLGEAELTLEIQFRTEDVPRRSWSSDPDANARVVREVREAVVLLRALDENGTREVWRGEARSRLAEAGRIMAPSASKVWADALQKAIEAFPANRAGDS